MEIQPYILGSGRAAQALHKSLLMLSVQEKDLTVRAPHALRRGEKLPTPPKGEFAVLILANPPGLHTQNLLEADSLGYRLIIAEKPICVSLDEVKQLRSLKTPVAVCHVYRQMWGVQTLKQMISSGELGDIVALEGRYWQSSTAQRAWAKLNGNPVASNWKNDVALSGHSDVLLDTGTHWADTAIYLIGTPTQTQIWRSYANAEAPHRDSHVQLQMQFASGTRAMASISKNFHGAPNQFEINLIGTKKSATWKFMDPDRIEIGEGATMRSLARSETQLGAQQGAFHGTGWLEGYIEIIRQALRKAQGQEFVAYPTLSEGLDVVEILLSAKE